MRYWIITTEYPPFHGGGISTYCYNTVKALEKQGVEVTIFVSDHSLHEKKKKERINNTTIIRFHPGNRSYNSYLGYEASLSKEFLDILNEEGSVLPKPDYIEIQDYKGIGYYILHDKKLNSDSIFLGIPIIITVHSPSYVVFSYDHAATFQLPNFWVGEMEKWCLNAADFLIFPSNYAKNEILPHLTRNPESTITLFHPFCNNSADKIINGTKEQILGLNKTEPLDIVFFGKLTYIKGVLQLANFFSLLWDNGFEFPLHFIGDDHFYNARNSQMKDYIIKKHKRHFDSGKIIFEGKVSPNNVRNRIAKADIVIISSLFETFSYACVEAMASAKIVLASDSGGQSELIKDGISGFLYKQNNFESFSTALQRICSLSDKEKQKIHQEALKFVSNSLNIEIIGKKKIKLLKSIKLDETDLYPFSQHVEKRVSSSNKSFVPGLLSIVVPYYNSGKYLRETIENLTQIDYRNKEIIVINDGTDDLESIAVLYALQEEYNFQIISQPNKGLPITRNIGALNAKGEFLAYLDADDKVAPSYHSKAIEIMTRYKNVSYVGCWTQYFDGANSIWPTYTPEPPYVLLHNTVNTSSLVFRRNDFLVAGMNDPEFMYTLEDQESIINMLANGYRGVAIPEILFFYRISSTSMSAQFNKTNLLHGYCLLSTKHKQLYQRYAVEIYNFLNSNGPSYLYDNPTWEPYTDVKKLWNQINHLTEKLNLYEIANQMPNSVVLNQEIDMFPNEIVIENDFKSRELQNWYNKEYEVLPLWYKRLGHIVKVFQGHRTLKSLFVDEPAKKK